MGRQGATEHFELIFRVIKRRTDIPTKTQPNVPTDV